MPFVTPDCRRGRPASRIGVGRFVAGGLVLCSLWPADVPARAGTVAGGETTGPRTLAEPQQAADSGASKADPARPGASPDESPPRGEAGEPAASASPNSPGPSVRAFEEPRQVLRLLDVGESELGSFVAGQSITSDDEEALVKILYRLPQIALDDIHRWQTSTVPWDSLSTDVPAMQTRFFVLRGRVRDVARRNLRPRLAALFDFSHYYEVRLDATDGRHTLVVCTRTIPEAWQTVREIDERVEASAMFLKPGPEVDAKRLFYFAAPRVAWLPDREEPALNITRDHVLLGDLGMDVGLFDAVRGRNGLPIGGAERECFYQLLHAVRGTQAALLHENARDIALVPLLQQPETHHGQLLRVRGTARQVTKVLVEESDVRSRFGIDHYYQLDILVPLGNQVIELRGAENSPEHPSYHGSFPLTVCAARLPERWSQLSGSGPVNEPITISGFFFKVWAYENPFVARFDSQQLQLCPTLMSVEPLSSQTTDVPTRGTGMLAGIAFLALLCAVWITVWYFHRSDRKFVRAARHRRMPPSP